MIQGGTQVAILYVRETPGHDLQAEIDTCRRYAEGRGYAPVTVVLDLQMPGPAYRLGWRGVMDMVTAGDVPLVVACTPAQVSKDPTRLQAIQEMLAERNCELHFAEGSAQ